jgi:hypothetical protein
VPCADRWNFLTRSWACDRQGSREINIQLPSATGRGR